MPICKCTITLEDSDDRLQLHVNGDVETLTEDPEGEAHRSAALHIYSILISQLKDELQSSEHFSVDDADTESDSPTE